jgi:hypothetical protein
MRRTDFCHLTSSYEHPRLVGFRSSRVWARAERTVGCFTSARLTSAGRTSSVAAEPLTPLSPPSATTPLLARGSHSREPPRPLSDVRVNERQRDDPERLPSDEDPCPATPSRASVSGLFQLRGFATAQLAVVAFGSLELLSRILASLAPGHADRCQRVRASLSFGDARRLLQPVRPVGTPTERSIPAREWGFWPRYPPAPLDASCVG